MVHSVRADIANRHFANAFSLEQNLCMEAHTAQTRSDSLCHLLSGGKSAVFQSCIAYHECLSYSSLLLANNKLE